MASSPPREVKVLNKVLGELSPNMATSLGEYCQQVRFGVVGQVAMMGLPTPTANTIFALCAKSYEYSQQALVEGHAIAQAKAGALYALAKWFDWSGNALLRLDDHYSQHLYISTAAFFNGAEIETWRGVYPFHYANLPYLIQQGHVLATNARSLTWVGGKYGWAFNYAHMVYRYDNFGDACGTAQELTATDINLWELKPHA